MFAGSHSFGFSGFSVLVKPNASDMPRLGMTIPKRCVANSVDRNRIKRLIREGFRHRKQAFIGYDLLFLVKRGLGTWDNGPLNNALNVAWQKVSKHTAQP